MQISCCWNQKSVTTYIRLSFLSVLAGGLDGTHRLVAFTKIVKVLVGDNFSLDETSLEITVDGPSSLWCQTSPWDSPASDLFLTGYE